MIKYLDEDRAKKYKGAADRIMAAIIEKCGNRDLESSNGILLHGTYARDSKENTCKDRGVDECNTWGDYFYMEALTRMLSDWKMYW